MGEQVEYKIIERNSLACTPGKTYMLNILHSPQVIRLLVQAPVVRYFDRGPALASWMEKILCKCTVIISTILQM